MEINEISFSSLNEFMNYCPLKYYYRKIKEFQPEFITSELVYGSGFHNALEAFFVGRLEETDVSLKQMVDIFAESFSQPSIKYNGQSKDELISEGSELLTIAREQEYGKLLGVEVPIEVKLPQGLILTGFIDLLTEENGKKVISDFKTAKKRPSVDDVSNHQQLTVYNLAYPLADLRLLVFLKQKTPAFEAYSTQRTQEQKRRIVKTIVSVRNAMEQECWFPREGFWCGGCGYREQCKMDF